MSFIDELLYPKIEMTEERPFFNSVFNTIMQSDYSEQLDEVLKLREENPGHVVSNRGGWQSLDYNYNSHEWMIPMLDDLGGLVAPIYKAYGINKPVGVMNYWFNVNGKHNYNEVHNHPGMIMSGVFYWKVPKNSGNLDLLRPDKLVDYLHTDFITDYNVGRYTYVPVEKLFLVFPSYIDHSVGQNLTEDEDDLRISLAINFR